MQKRIAQLMALAVAVVVGGVSADAKAQTTVIPVTNASFEQPGTPGNFGGVVPGWIYETDSFPDGSPMARGTNTRDNGNYPNQGLPGGAGEGAWVGFFNLHLPQQAAQAYSDPVSFAVTANTRYDLTVALGSVATERTGSYRFGLVAGTNYQLADDVLPFIARTDFINGEADIPEGTLKDYTLSFTVGPVGTNSPAVEALIGTTAVARIQIRNYNTTLGDNGETVLNQNTFDNVRFTATVIPEPMTAGILAAGSLLLGRRRRA